MAIVARNAKTIHKCQLVHQHSHSRTYQYISLIPKMPKPSHSWTDRRTDGQTKKTTNVLIKINMNFGQKQNELVIIFDNQKYQSTKKE